MFQKKTLTMHCRHNRQSYSRQSRQSMQSHHSLRQSGTLSLRPALSNALSNVSVSSMGRHRQSSHGSHNAHYNFSTQLTNRSWVKLQVDSVYHDLKNDEYELKLSDSMVLSFDFNTRQCSLRMPSSKVRLETLLTDQAPNENFEDIDKFLEEIDNQTSILQLSNISNKWSDLWIMCFLYYLLMFVNHAIVLLLLLLFQI